MFCTNVLFHDACFDPISSPSGNMALTIHIPSSIEKLVLFFTFIAYIKSKRENF
jgi:hypothetical protein